MIIGDYIKQFWFIKRMDTNLFKNMPRMDQKIDFIDKTRKLIDLIFFQKLKEIEVMCTRYKRHWVIPQILRK